jgi:hypothetical protein
MNATINNYLELLVEIPRDLEVVGLLKGINYCKYCQLIVCRHRGVNSSLLCLVLRVVKFGAINLVKMEIDMHTFNNALLPLAKLSKASEVPSSLTVYIAIQ